MAVTPHGGSAGPAEREPRPEHARVPWYGLPWHSRVRDLKIHQVVPVAPGADYATLVAAVHDHHHDLLPVVEGGLLVGLVAASDLLGRLAVQALPGRGTRIATRQVRALRRRAAGVTAGELMSAPAWTVTEDTGVAEAAALAIRHRVHHLPVTDHRNRLVGLVCLCDLLGAVRRDDAEVRSEVLYLAVATDVGADRASLRVDCEHGRIQLTACTARHSQANTLLARVRAVEGVVAVNDTLSWDADDLLAPRQPQRF